jgi:hypothetical protein
MKPCDACGTPDCTGGVWMGRAHLCRVCSVDVREELDQLHAQGKPASALGIARRIFREQHSAGGYLLRDIPQDLWTQAKHAAIDKDLSLRDLILKALRAYLS